MAKWKVSPVLTRMDRCQSCGLVRLYVFGHRGQHDLRYDYGEAPDYVRRGSGRVPKSEDRAALVSGFLKGRTRDRRERALLTCHGTQHEWKFGPLIRGIDPSWVMKSRVRAEDRRITTIKRARLRAV